jgi:hypothetical protein
MLQASVRVYRDSKDAVARTVTALGPLHEQLAAAPAAGRHVNRCPVRSASMPCIVRLVESLPHVSVCVTPV